MRMKWIAVLIAVLALGAIAAGCGGDDSTSSSSTTEATSSDTSTTEDSTSSDATSSDTTSSDTSSSTPDDVYNACLDVIKGTAAEAAGETACAQARDAFENCTSQAESAPEGDARDLAIQACQDAADQATQALPAAG